MLISVGTNLICALAIKPGLCKSDGPPRSSKSIPHPILPSSGSVCRSSHPCIAGINALFPTLLSPNALMVGLYWAVLYVLQGGFTGYRRGWGIDCSSSSVGFCLTLLLARKQATKVSQ